MKGMPSSQGEVKCLLSEQPHDPVGEVWERLCEFQTKGLFIQLKTLRVEG